MTKLWLLDFNYCQNNKAQWKNLRAFLKILDIITGYLLLLFIYLFIFSFNKFHITTVNKSFYNLNLLNYFNMQNQFPRAVLPEEGVLRMCCEFSAVYPCVGVISIKLRSGFVDIALLHCCSPVGWLHVCRASFLENTSGGLLLNKHNFIYDF